MIFASAYSHSTPQMYKGQLHSALGWITFFLAFGLSFAQIARAGVALSFKNAKATSFGYRIRSLMSEKQGAEYEPLRQPEVYEDAQNSNSNVASFRAETPTRNDHLPELHLDPWGRPHRQTPSREILEQTRTVPTNHWQLPHDTMSPNRPSSDDTLNDEHLSPRTLSPPIPHGPQLNPPRAGWEPEQSFSGHEMQKSKLASFIKYGEIFLWRFSIPLAWVCIVSGLAVYSGGCRGTYMNGCVAHTIKGSIFFWYGLITFGRYCGAWAELGWAWNKKPNVVGTWRDRFPSAEMVECFVIWLYGATNTWMERFGAQHGDPYTVKQVQHISIAVMYFFAGGAGMM